ncbi:hypothetical protein Tco_1139731, partial [Tanacetum coccineum]
DIKRGPYSKKPQYAVSNPLETPSFEEEFPVIVYNDALTFELEVSSNFENEFPAIVYNDALTSEPEVSSEPTVNAYPAIKVDFDFEISSKEDLEAYQAQLKQTREIKSSRFLPLLKLIHTRYIVLDLPNTPYPLDQNSQNSKLVYKSRQTTVPFPSHLDNHYCEEEEGIYGPKFTEAYGASHINHTIPRKEKDPRSFTLLCFINNVCFDNAWGLLDLGDSVSVMSLLDLLNLGLGDNCSPRLTVDIGDKTVYIQ